MRLRVYAQRNHILCGFLKKRRCDTKKRNRTFAEFCTEHKRRKKQSFRKRVRVLCESWNVGCFLRWSRRKCTIRYDTFAPLFSTSVSPLTSRFLLIMAAGVYWKSLGLWRRGLPSRVHGRFQHTMGNAVSAWFGRNPSGGRIVDHFVPTTYLSVLLVR